MIRKQVFIEEQQVPAILEWDTLDAVAMHLLGTVDGQPVACARVLNDGHIGRMAVLPEWRGQGIGEALLLQAIQECQQLEVTHARLSAQTHAIGFYARAGFVVSSEPYLDANILHVDMQLELV
jgi:predicted GNAT family N-acyltransferase